ncbi:MAG: OprO/OprP family phosphate-selective porin [Porticoccaceae bacterium]
MKKTAIALAILSAGAASVQAGTITTDGPDIVVKTKGGLEAKTADGKASFKIGGRMQLDYNSYDGVINAKSIGDDGSDIFFRRARLELAGHYQDWAYEIAYNLTDSGSIDQLHTTYTGFGKLALLTFGQQKENFGLEDTGSSKWITAMERSLPANAFDTGNNVGVKLHGANDLVTYSAGIFKQDLDGEHELDTAATGRLVVRPMYGKDGLIHLGIGYTTRESDGHGFDAIESRLGVRGGSDGKATKVEAEYTGGAIADEMEVWNAELAASFGPFHAMAEYFDGELSGMGGAPDLDGEGYYVQVGYIVTGETRGYKTGIAAFDKVKPSGPGGAWEVFTRYDELDLGGNQDPLIDLSGDTGNTFTLGVNWYANELVKVALNYVHAETDEEIGGEDDGDALVARLQYAF